MSPSPFESTASGPSQSGVRYLVTIDLERGRTLRVLRQMADGSLQEVTRRDLPSTAGGPHPTPAGPTLH